MSPKAPEQDHAPKADIRPRKDKTLMRRKKAAEYINTSERFLENAALKGTGPRFIRLSRRMVLYREEDLDDWLAQHTISSTSEVV
jgi:predicted DNA-binding transcriptional regulator AlpA